MHIVLIVHHHFLIALINAKRPKTMTKSFLLTFGASVMQTRQVTKICSMLQKAIT